MIEKFKHKGLQYLHEKGDRSKVSAFDVGRLIVILSTLDWISMPYQINDPSYRLHQLQGDRKGTWAVKVDKNWRVTFRFANGNVTDVNLEDYH
jgi:toxin HigB-1